MDDSQQIKVKQGEIWLADLNPAQGSEQAGFRPVVVLSGNMLNSIMPVVFVAPLTSRIKRFKGNPVLEPDNTNGLKQPSELLVFHFRSISKNRLRERVGKVREETIRTAITTLNDLLKY